MKFEVGDRLVCDCGDSACVPFTVIEVSEDLIFGTDELVYVPSIDTQLRKLTKLEKALS